MYFPIGWSKTLRIRLKSTIINSTGEQSNSPPDQQDEQMEDLSDCDEKLLSIKTNLDKSFLCVLTNLSLRIWFCKPSVEIVSHFRNENSIRTFGFNKNATWKPDSNMIIVQTTLDYLLFYRVVLKYDDQELFVQNNIGIMAAEEEAIICTQTGEILGVNWDGSIDENFHWNLNDNQYSSSNPNLLNDSSEGEHDSLFYVINHEYSSAIGGFSLVFANGKAAFLPLKNEEGESPDDSPATDNQTTTTTERKYCIKKLHFVNEVDNAIVTAINHKYQILAFGLKNSEAILCFIDDLTNTVVITHHLSLSSSSFTNANNMIGALNCLQWSPDSSVLAASWAMGGFVIWSVFGSLLSCSLGWDYGTATNQNKYKLNIFESLTWGKEGYQLWTLEKTLVQPSEGSTLAGGSLNSSLNCQRTKLVYKTNLSQFSMVKSILASNPSCISNCGEHVLLIGEDRLYLGFEATNTHVQSDRNFLDNDNLNDDTLPSTNTTNGIQWEHQSTSLGNHQLVIIAMPPSYYSTNSPMRFASIDQTGQYIAIACKNGFALYSMLTRKWKLFGNETQEKDFEVCGGLSWFKEMIVMGCFNLIDCCFEIRVYSLHLKLDNQNAKICKVPCDILLMSINKNHLLVYLLDGSFYLYGFYEMKKQHNLETISSASSSLSINSKPHHTSSLLTSKFSQAASTHNQRTNLSSFHLILMHQIVSNVIVSPECVTSIILSSLHSDNYSKQQSTSDHTFNDLILMNVCGRLFLLEIDYLETKNMNKQNQQNGGGLVNGLTRSMSFQGNQQLINQMQTNPKIPLVYKVVSVLASGVENVWVNNNSSNEINEKVKRPHLSNALWLACGMRGIQTVVHCARKTELALWPHLFSIVGNPKDLFQQCIDEDKLSTAASYIIVLHNLEQKSISKQYATTLLNKATEKKEHSLVNDLVRFLNAIEPSELSTTTNSITSKVNMNPISSSIHTKNRYLLSHSSLNTSTNQDLLSHHNPIMQLNQLNLNTNKNQMIGRKRTQSSSASLMLQHSNSLESPHSNHVPLAPTSSTTNQIINQLTNGTISAFTTNHTTTLTNSTGLTTSTGSLASTTSATMSNHLSDSLSNKWNQTNQTNNYHHHNVPFNPYFSASSRSSKSPNSIVAPGAVTLIQKNQTYKLMNNSQDDDDDRQVEHADNNGKILRNGSVNRANSFNQKDKSMYKEARRHSIADTSNSSTNCKLQ